MLTIGPFSWSGSDWGSQWSHEDQEDIELCDKGVDHIFPELAKDRLVQFNLYTHRPRGRDIVDAELQLHYYQNELDQIRIAFPSKDGSYDGNDLTYTSLSPDEYVAQEILEEFGLLDEVITRITKNNAIDRYFAYVKAVPLGKTPIEIDNVNVDYSDEDVINIDIRSTTGLISTVILKTKDLKWEEE